MGLEKFLRDARAKTAAIDAPSDASVDAETPGEFEERRRAEYGQSYEEYLKARSGVDNGPPPMSREEWMRVHEKYGLPGEGREWQLNEAAEDLREGGYDQETADRYESEARSEIDPVFYAQSKALANDYARRGLSDSGMSAGAQEDASLRWAAQRRLANERAIDRATGDRRSQILDSAGLTINMLNYDLQRQALRLQQQALDKQGEQDYLGQALGVAGTVVGGLYGGPAGAAAGGAAGGALGDAVGGGGGGGTSPALMVQIDPLTGEEVFVDPYSGTRY